MEIHPEAKYYYELESSTLVFKFPTPERLDGIASTTRSVSHLFQFTPFFLLCSYHQLSSLLPLLLFPPFFFICSWPFFAINFTLVLRSITAISWPIVGVHCFYSGSALTVLEITKVTLNLSIFMFFGFWSSNILLSMMMVTGYEDGQYHIHLSRSYQANTEQHQVFTHRECIPYWRREDKKSADAAPVSKLILHNAIHTSKLLCSASCPFPFPSC